MYFNHLYVMLLVFFALHTISIFMLVLMLEVQKGCNDVVDTCILGYQLFT